MKAILAIAKRETGAYFSGPIGWICLIGFAGLSGLFFSLALAGYASQAAEMGGMNQQDNVTNDLLRGFLGNLTIVLLLMVPALSMGLIAADRKERSIELLLTSPVPSWQIVLGKYMGGMAFALVAVASTAYAPAVLYWMGDPDRGVFLAVYGAFTLFIAVFMAVGLFASSLTENQLIALVLGFCLNLGLWIIGWGAQIAGEGKLKQAFDQAALLSHFENLSSGVAHASDAVYFLSFIGFLLFATTQRVEALRWR